MLVFRSNKLTLKGGFREYRGQPNIAVTKVHDVKLYPMAIFNADVPWGLWCWLNAGNHASAIAAIGSIFAGIAGIIGLVGLWRYVEYTKTMMEAAVASQKAEFQPCLIIRVEPLPAKPVPQVGRYDIQNVGRGPALNVYVAEFSGREAQNRFGVFTVNPLTGHLLGDLLSGERIATPIKPRTLRDEEVVVHLIQTELPLGGLRQLHVKFQALGGGRWMLDVKRSGEMH
jgi:hypothetical protein